MEFGENFDNCLDSALHLYIFVYICTYLLVICKYMGYPMATCSNIRTYKKTIQNEVHSAKVMCKRSGIITIRHSTLTLSYTVTFQPDFADC